MLKNKVGEEKINNQGLKMKIIKYNGSLDIDIKFEDGTIIKNRTYDNFKKGNIKNLYYPSVYGVGYFGEGEYKSKINGKQTREYNIWNKMLQRCYDEKYHRKEPNYIGCTVCEEWYNFQNFAKWYEDNYYEIENDVMCLDKDILVKGNKIYSPDTCVFVPNRINCLFIKSNKTRGKYPIGVYWHKQLKKFGSQCNININSQKHLGLFDTEIEAFNAYKKFKEYYIKQVANKYKDIIPEKLYNAMYNWKVGIDD